MFKKNLLLAAILAVSSGCSYTKPNACTEKGCVTKLDQTAAKTELKIMKGELLRLGVSGQILTREIANYYDPATLNTVRETSHSITDTNGLSEVEIRVVETTGKKASDSNVTLQINPVKINYEPGNFFHSTDSVYYGVLKAAAKLADFYLKSKTKPSLVVRIVGMASASVPRQDAKLGLLWGQTSYTFSDLNNRASLRRCGTTELIAKTFKSTDAMTNPDLGMLRAIDLYKRLISEIDYETRAFAKFDLCFDISPKRGHQYIYSEMNIEING
ncbi:MAG: hypothetical protein ACPG5R_07585 [Cognaticolwellia aestuarii]